ncbi:hypothetical protein BDR06DRAFT_890283, partial [Suillus hirtellus]
PSVMKYKTSLGRHPCEVLGITSTYTVFPHLDVTFTAVSGYCTCLCGASIREPSWVNLHPNGNR